MNLLSCLSVFFGGRNRWLSVNSRLKYLVIGKFSRIMNFKPKPSFFDLQAVFTVVTTSMPRKHSSFDFVSNYWMESNVYDIAIHTHSKPPKKYAGGVLIPRAYHQPLRQHFCADMNYHWYGHIYKLTVYKTFNFLKY